MAIDVNKLIAFKRSGLPLYDMQAVATTPGLPDDLDESDVEEIREELQDDSSEGAQLCRKLSPEVGYMELSEPAGFSCGACKWFEADGICLHASVRAPVDGEAGCCNLFQPSSATVVFPPPEAKGKLPLY